MSNDKFVYFPEGCGFQIICSQCAISPHQAHVIANTGLLAFLKTLKCYRHLAIIAHRDTGKRNLKQKV
jgi:hypothetical protein